MRTLDLIPSSEHLYDYRGAPGRGSDSVPFWLPHHQGDIFDGVVVPGVEAPTKLAMLFLHPCTMRRGAILKAQVTVIQVRKESQKKVIDTPDAWVKQFSIMPLPDLYGVGKGTWVADFMKIGTVNSDLLDRNQRVAVLSNDGRNLLQQRIVNHLTRHAPSLEELREATAGVQIEIDLQTTWAEAACSVAGSEDARTVSSAESAFDTFMSIDSRRAKLGDQATATRVVMEVNQHIIEAERLGDLRRLVGDDQAD